MDFVDYVNELPPSSRLGALGDYLSEVELGCPVDMYQRNVAKILLYGTQKRLAQSDFLGRLLVIGVISSAEAYVRMVLSACLEFCPVSRAIASRQNIHLGGLLWHGQEGFSRSAFEHASFASKEEITNACKKYLGVPLDDQTFKSLLDEFENVCHLRHGIVHSDGLLPGRNAVIMNIPQYTKPVRIVIRYQQLQDITAVVNTLIMTLNRHLFTVICQRWAIDWRQRADWNPKLETKRFKAIWKQFHSVDERKRRKGRSHITMSNCLDQIRTTYNL